MVILYTATLITAKVVIPARAGIQPPAHAGLPPGHEPFRGGAWPGGKITGFPRIKNGAGLVKPGMTDCVRLMSSCIIE